MTTSWNPISWLGGTTLLEDSHTERINGSSSVPKRKKILTTLLYGSVVAPAWFWVSQVTRHVPEPYLDEVFHVPQAQAYCDGKYGVWDPKLTTPPGLYGFATLFAKLVGGGVCNVYTLRLFNTIVLLLTMAYASACRDLIVRLSHTNKSSTITREWLNSHAFISLNTVHTAVNIALFPPLFFFSGLFYTDVLSTAAVLCMYMTFLRRAGAYENSTAGSFRLYVIGVVALTMRQTNIFWVAIFMGGLEAVRTVKGISGFSGAMPAKIPGNREELMAAVERYKVGQIHDVELSQAGLPDFVLCIISLAIAILYHPVLILTRLWPYIALLLSFASFVIWNGGVVLGDKSNHVATIHLPQLLYLSAFTAFFSFPLLLPSALNLVPGLLTARLPQFLQPPPTPTSSRRSMLKLALTLTTLALGFVVTLATIRANTIIHPFTLADNRHYVFYVFRYTILRHRAIRYLLAPVYLLSGWLAFKTLAGTSATRAPARSKPDTAKAPKAMLTDTNTSIQGQNVATDTAGPTTSFLLILSLSTALSLITAPLVEPRYFIIPWTLWRLHLPSLSSASSSSSPPRPAKVEDSDPSGEDRSGGRSMDYRLYLETAWFLAINGVTGYVFLYRGFEWAQEPGSVQRFMW